MRLFATLLTSALILLGTTSDGWTTKLERAERVDLASVTGGQCQDCGPSGATCAGTTCTKQNDGTFLQKVGTLITPLGCANVAKGVQGYTKCQPIVPMACFNCSTCSGIDNNGNCTGCGAAGACNPPNTQPTQCTTTGGYNCKGT